MKKFFKNKIIRKFLVWRIWLFVPILVAISFLPFREGSLFTIFTGFISEYTSVESSLIYPWSNFDGIHYLSIASRGYIAEGRFLPLFPILIRLVASPFIWIFNLEPSGRLLFWIGLILSNFFFVLSLFLLKKLLKLDYSEKFSNKVILLLLIFPTSFFFVSIYTESLFLLLSILVLFFARKKEWGKAILFSTLLSIARLPGILILIPLLYEYLVYEVGVTSKNWKQIFVQKRALVWSKLFSLLKFLIIPLPLILYAIFNYHQWSDPLFFVNSHASLGNSREVSSMVFPLVTIYRYLKIFLTVSTRQYELWVAVIEFLSLTFAVFGIIFAFSKKMKEMGGVRLSYLFYSIALILLPLLSGTLTGFPRYLLLGFPIFIGFVAKFEKSKYTWKIIIFCSLLAQAILLALFSRGWFVA